MIPFAADARGGQRGFTLMELLIALTLLGLLMAALFGGVRLGTRVWEVSTERQAIQGRTEAVRHFLERRLEEAQPLAFGTGRVDRQPFFAGERHHLVLASSMPASLGPGVFLLDLRLRQQDGDGPLRDLVVRWRPLILPDAVDAAGERGERVLMGDVVDMDVAYFGVKDDAALPGWHDRWTDGAFLPELIRLDLRFVEGDARRWLPLVVSPMIDAWYDPGS